MWVGQVPVDFVSVMGSLSGKTMNSWLGNHDITGMLPIPPKAVERGLAYVRWWSPPVLCIGGMTVTSGFEQVRRFVDSF